MILNSIKKRAKIVAIILLVLFGASSISYFVYLATALLGNNNDPIVLTINDKKIKKSELEVLLSSRSYEEFKVINLNSFIERNLLLDKAKALHIAVSSQEINEEYKKKLEEMRKNVKLPDNELVVRILARISPANYLLEKGSPYKMLRKVIGDDIALKKLREKIENSYTPTEEEIKIKFEAGDKKKPLEEVKEEIVKKLKNENKYEYYNIWLEDFVNSSNNKVELKDDSYKIYLKQPILSLGNLSVSNVNFYYNILIYTQYPFILGINEELSEEQQKELIYKKVYEKLSGELVIANEAIKRGLKVKKSTSFEGRVHELVKALRDNITTNLKYSTADIQTYFNRNKAKYDEKERLYAYTFSLEVTPSSEDIYNIRNEAEKILKEALEKKMLPATKKTFTKDEFNKNFDAKLNENEIYSQLLKREGSYYIVKALKDKVEYVKVDEKASHKTKEEIKKRANDIVKDIKDGKITFEKALESYAKAQDKKEKGPLYKDSTSIDKNLLNKLFTLKENEIFVFEASNNIYIAKRSSYFPKKDASFNNFKDKATEDYKREKTDQAFEALKQKLIKDSKIEVKDENLKSMIKI